MGAELHNQRAVRRVEHHHERDLRERGALEHVHRAHQVRRDAHPHRVARVPQRMLACGVHAVHDDRGRARNQQPKHHGARRPRDAVESHHDVAHKRVERVAAGHGRRHQLVDMDVVRVNAHHAFPRGGGGG